jgi:hypothetical protein
VFFLPPRKKGNISPSGSLCARKNNTALNYRLVSARAAFVRCRKGWSCATPSAKRAAGRPWKGQRGEGNFFAALIQHLELQPIYTLPPRALCNPIHGAEGKKAAAPSPNAFISFSLSTFRTMSGCIQIPYQMEQPKKYGACQNRNCHVWLSSRRNET